jgi:translation initiation factor 1
MVRDDGARTVYSSHGGRLCPKCGRPAAACRCPAAAAASSAFPNDGVVRVRREKQGRGGKTVTTVAGVPLPPDGLRDLAAELKRRCGSGGTAKAGVIEIQGEHVETVMAELAAKGWRVKRAGG